MLLHETLNEIKAQKIDDFFFKVDFEKAYNKINWSFVFEILKMKGFPELFLSWVRKTVENGKVAIMAKYLTCKYFNTCKGLRQGDTFPPFCSTRQWMC